MSKQRGGFTLLEMAVVLVIIALIIGAIAQGRSLLLNSKLQAVIKERGMYVRAMKEFQDKFQQIPGDFSGATAMWGTDPVGCPNAVYTSTLSTDTKTCNGDGNGRIGATTNAGVVSGYDEWFRFWQHLVNAKMIDGRYTGVRGFASTSASDVGVNVPASQFTPAGWTIIYFQNTSADNVNFFRDLAGGYGHLLFFGAQTASSYTYGAVMTPADALYIDQKIDDGFAGLGKVRALRSGGVLPTCTTSDTSQAALKYNTSSKTTVCSLFFLVGY